MIKKTFNSLIFALRGIATVWREENNFKIQVVLAIAVVISMFYFDFLLLEKVFCIFAITMVLVSEMINTAIEDLCNKVQPLEDPVIGKIKDISSGFVLISALAALSVGGIVFFTHFGIKLW